MVFAVPIKLQAPGPSQARHSIWWNSSRVINPSLRRPIASLTSLRMIFLPPSLLGAIGPPVTKRVGRSNWAAAISMPGTILSHEHSMTRPLKRLARTISSTEAAITSRNGRM